MGQTERALADEIYIMRAARSVAVVVLFVVKTRVQGHDDRERRGSVQAGRQAAGTVSLMRGKPAKNTSLFAKKVGRAFREGQNHPT